MGAASAQAVITACDFDDENFKIADIILADSFFRDFIHRGQFMEHTRPPIPNPKL
jgi:reverse gyrase